MRTAIIPAVLFAVALGTAQLCSRPSQAVAQSESSRSVFDDAYAMTADFATAGTTPTGTPGWLRSSIPSWLGGYSTEYQNQLEMNTFALHVQLHLNVWSGRPKQSLDRNRALATFLLVAHQPRFDVPGLTELRDQAAFMATMSERISSPAEYRNALTAELEHLTGCHVDTSALSKVELVNRVADLVGRNALCRR